MTIPEVSRPALRPSLWRTCRVLANRVRLRLLWELVRRPGQTVGEVAIRLHVSGPVASKYLRELNARGLLEAHRVGGSVYYRPHADPSVADAKPLLAALAATFRSQAKPVDFIFRQVTGFTHARRLSVVAILGAGPVGFADLSERSQIPWRALSRHVKKLTDRGVIRCVRGRYRMAKPECLLAATLLKLAQAPGR
jgi:DNA-binding transcriptional ArsR family regulator